MIQSIYRFVFFTVIGIGVTFAEPWVNTKDGWLRADIETLSDAGIITVPISTYPLMWSGIIKDIDNTDIQNIADEYKAIYWRVKKSARRAMRKEVKQLLKTSAASSTQLLRSFGDDAGEKAQINARKSSMIQEIN